MKHCKTRIVILILCLCLCACSSNKVTSIVLSNDTIDVTIGQTYSLSAIILPENSDESITWQSTNEEIATVDSNGNITAVSIGDATIVVSSKSGVSSSCKVSVVDKPAYDKLNDTEKKFVDTFVKKAIGYFKAPDSVSIRKIAEYEGNSKTGGDFWMIEISSTNSFGGTDVGAYYLSMNGSMFVDGGNDSITLPDDYDCELITQAIQEKR